MFAPKPPHFAAWSKRVIFLGMEGGPSHVDTFDYKQRLTHNDGQEFGKGRLPHAKILRSPWRFRQHDSSGRFSKLFPHIARHADDQCIINSMHTDLPNHSQAFLQMQTGVFQPQRPSFGTWTHYGPGTEYSQVPGFIVLCPPVDSDGASNYGSSLPARD